MQIYLDLRKVLPEVFQAELAEEIGITEHQLKHLLQHDATTISQAQLNKVINYLLRQRLVHEADLPDILFSKRYDKFWPMLSERKRLELITGSRKGLHDWREVVSAADSILQFNVLYLLTEDGHQQSQVKTPRRVIDARLVDAWDHDGGNHKNARTQAVKQHRKFKRSSADRGLVLFGSVKSNPVVCPSIASCFVGAEPFESEDDVDSPNDRSCPFMLLYRQEDPKPPSCCGGLQLSKQQPGSEPGIYYEVELGQPWKHIPSNEKYDAALVFYRFEREPQNRLEVVLGGFSGRATRCLAEYLRKEDAGAFSPTYSEEGMDVGVFIVKFELASKQSELGYGYHDFEVIPLAKEVLLDRVVRPRRKNARKKDGSSKSKKR